VQTSPVSLRLSMWTSFFWEFTPEDALRHIGSLGWRFVDFSAEHLGLLWREGSKAHMRDVRDLMAELEIVGWQTHGPMQSDPVLRGGKVLEKWRSLVRGWLETAAELGIKHFVLHPAVNKEMDRDEVFRANLEAFRDLARDAERTGVKVTIENLCHDVFGSTPDDLCGLLDEIGSDMLCVCLDSSHANVQGLDIAAAVKRLGSRLECLHLSDNDTSGDQHRLPFDGNFKWYELARALKDVDFPGTLSFEMGGLFRQRTPSVAVRNIQMKYIENLMAEIFNPSAPPGYGVSETPLEQLCKIAWISEYDIE